MLIHYVIIRRDLPLGVAAAQITHAAGESGCFYQDPYTGRFMGATAVVLEVPNEAALDKAVIRLLDYSIPHIRVRESEGPFAGQEMAIGVVPGDRDKLGPILEPFQALKYLTGDPGDECSCTNCRLDKPTEVS